MLAVAKVITGAVRKHMRVGASVWSVSGHNRRGYQHTIFALAQVILHTNLHVVKVEDVRERWSNSSGPTTGVQTAIRETLCVNLDSVDDGAVDDRSDGGTKECERMHG